MKTALCCLLPLALPLTAHAGINGAYKVTGTETDSGGKYTFSGTITVTNYKAASYSLKFNDSGENANFRLNFTTPLKDSTLTQKVNCTSSIGTGTATFSYVAGHYKVDFTYKSKSGNVKGSGTGRK